MPGKRKETMDIREMLRHLRRGQSNRAVAKTMGIDRKTVARYRTWAIEQGLLEGSLPPLGELHRMAEETLNSPAPPQNTSSVEPYREVVGKLRQEGVEVAAICDAETLSRADDIDLTADPIGQDADGQDVYLRDIWPTQREIDEAVTRGVLADQFKQLLDPDQLLRRRMLLSPGRRNLALCFCADNPISNI